jgi:hypothetical protein
VKSRKIKASTSKTRGHPEGGAKKNKRSAKIKKNPSKGI